MAHAPARPKNNDVHGLKASELPPPTVTSDKAEWIAARQRLLAMEKDITRAYDEMVKERRKMPWIKLDKDYQLTELATGAQVSLFDIVRQKDEKGERKPLILQHFMVPVEFDSPCASCSMWFDGAQGIQAQLSKFAHYVAVMNPQTDEVEAKAKDYAAKNEWTWPVLSSRGTTFANDFDVSQTRDQIEKKELSGYNFRQATNPFELTELPGYSVFACPPGSDDVCRVNSVHGRGMEALCQYWAFLDLLPGGRNGEFGVARRLEVSLPPQVLPRKREREE